MNFRHAVVAFLCAATLPILAGDFSGLREEIKTARQSLVTMVLQRDKRGPEFQKAVKDTADAVSSHLSLLVAPQGKTAEFKELKETWAAFKRTRETELIPAILRNDRY